MNIAPLVNEQNRPEGLAVSEFTPLLVDQYVGCYFGSQFQDLLRYTSSSAEQRPAWCRFFPRATFQADPPRAEFLLTRLIDGESRDVTANAIPVSTQSPIPDDELNAFCDALSLLLARLDEQPPLVPNAQKFLRELQLPDPAFPEATSCYRLYDDGSGHQRLLVLWGIGNPIPTLHLQNPSLLRQRFADAKLIGSHANDNTILSQPQQPPAARRHSKLFPAAAIAAALLLVAIAIAILLQRSATSPTHAPLALASTPHAQTQTDHPDQLNIRPAHQPQLTPTHPTDATHQNDQANSQTQSPETKSIISENQSTNAVKGKTDAHGDKKDAHSENETNIYENQSTQAENQSPNAVKDKTDAHGDKKDAHTEKEAIIYENQSTQAENQPPNAVKGGKTAEKDKTAARDERQRNAYGDKKDALTEKEAIIYENQSTQAENQSQNAVRDEKTAEKDKMAARDERQRNAHGDKKDAHLENETNIYENQPQNAVRDAKLTQEGKREEAIQQTEPHQQMTDGSRHVADGNRQAEEKLTAARPPHIRCLPSIPLDQPTHLVITTALLDHDLQPNSARLVSLRLLRDDGQPALAPLSLQDMTAIFDLTSITRPTTLRWQGTIAFQRKGGSREQCRFGIALDYTPRQISNAQLKNLVLQIAEPSKLQPTSNQP